MSSDSETPPTNDGWVPWWLWWTWIGLVVLILPLGSTYLGLTWKWKADFEEQVRKLKKDGRLYSPKSLQEDYEERTTNQIDYTGTETPAPIQEAYLKIKSKVHTKNLMIRESKGTCFNLRLKPNCVYNRRKLA